MAPVDDSDSGMESQEGSQSLEQEETPEKSSKEKKYPEIEDDINNEVNIYVSTVLLATLY